MSRHRYEHPADPREAGNEFHFANEVGRLVGQGLLADAEAVRSIHAWPGVRRTELDREARTAADPANNWISGYSTRLVWTMRESASATALEFDRQIHAARKLLGPLINRGTTRLEAARAVRANYPLLTPSEILRVTDEEVAWWLRWRHDRGMGDAA